MKKRLILIGCFLSLMFIGILFQSIPARAQEYSFEVNSEKVNVYIEKDGSITIEYWIKFTCDSGARSIDYVDIGFPNEHYDIDSVIADVDGNKVIVTGPSPYTQYGVEISLGIYSIAPGEKGTLHVKGNNPKMIYQDYEDLNMASVEFSPTWFDSNFCPTFDYLEVNFYFPDDLKDGNEVKYHYDKYDKVKRQSDGDLIYTWIKEDVPMQQYTFGVSFPLKYIDEYEPLTSNPQLVFIIVTLLLIISIAGLVVGGGYLIYRYKKEYKTRYYPPKPRTAPADKFALIICVAFFAGFCLLMFWAMLGDIILIFLFFGLVITGFGIIGFVLFKILGKRRLPYIKPNIKIDCVGVNKDLTVVEAAIIQNTPLSKVVFLIIFSLIRTGHLKILQAEPLTFEVIKGKSSENLRPYQDKFLESILTKGPNKGTVNDTKLKKLLVDVIKATYQKMTGFELDATIQYYQGMIKGAWTYVKKMPAEIEWDEIEKHFEYLVLDDNFESKSKRYLSDRYYYHRPYYYYNYYYYDHYYPHHYHHYHGGSATPPKEHVNIYTFSDSIVRGIENISNSIVTNFSTFSDKIVKSVAPVKRPSSTGHGGGGSHGGGCACACACAGCACACAGGGR